VSRASRLAAFALSASAALAVAQSPDENRRLAREIFRELVEIDTVNPTGDTTAAARAMAKRLLDAGFDAKDIEIVEPAPRKGNLVARYRGSGEKRPLLLVAHLDVVEAKKEDWSQGLDPLRLTERDGYYYGRGTLDDKAMGASYIANFIRMRREGYVPKRDLIVALTADEESGTHNGVEYLLKHRRALIDAELALNEGGSGVLKQGKPILFGVQVSEKVYQSFELVSSHAGGHSSLPSPDNPIYHLSRALDRVSKMQFPTRESAVTRSYFAQQAANLDPGPMAEAAAALGEGRATEEQIQRASSVPRYNAQLRTTCVATQLSGGHAENALPQTARAVVNCRIFPGDDPKEIAAMLRRVAGERVTVKALAEVRPSPAADAESPAMKIIVRVANEMWPGVPVMPVMSAGATDGLYLRVAGIPVYGTEGTFVEQGENRMHGRDERVPVKSFDEGVEFLYRLTRALAS
jgi:acetylornithine deacetylase/succinyl-diaminopimelate desuccinylase-like protein